MAKPPPKLTPAEYNAALEMCNVVLRGGDAKTILRGKAGRSLMTKLLVIRETQKAKASARTMANKPS